MAGDVGAALLNITLILVAAKLIGELFARARLTAVVGEVMAGIVIGPSLLGWVPSPLGEGFIPELLFFLGEVGAIILLFEVGLESDLKELLNVGPMSLAVAGLGLGVSFGAGYAGSAALAATGYLPDVTLFHVFVGAALTATSVGITARILSERQRLATNEARVLLGAAVLDDIAGLILLAVIAALAARGTVSVTEVSLTAGVAVAFLVVAILVGLVLAPRLARLAALSSSRGALIAMGVAVAFGLAWAADHFGLAAIVGAFVAGAVFAQSDQDERLFDQARVLGNVFTPIFFVTLGLMVDLRAVAAAGTPVWVVAGVLTVVGVAAKLTAGLGVRPSQASRLVVGIGMVPRGEVGFIFAVLGLRAGIFTADWQYAALLLVMLLTTVIAPLWLEAIDQRANWHVPGRDDGDGRGPREPGSGSAEGSGQGAHDARAAPSDPVRVIGTGAPDNGHEGRPGDREP